MAHFVSKIQVLMVLVFAYGLNWLAVGGSSAQADTAVALNEANYRWMLGQEYSAFNAGFELARRHGASPGLEMANESEIRQIFHERAGDRAISLIRKVSVTAMTPSGPTNYVGWAMWLDSGTVVGVKNSVYEDHTTGDTQISILRDNNVDVEEWFSANWYSLKGSQPFRVEFTAANLDKYQFSLPDLHVSGAHYDSYIMVDEFSRLDETRGLEWFKHNPEFKNFKAISRRRAVVAVLDSGVDYNNPRLGSKLAQAPASDRKAVIAGEIKNMTPWLNGLEKLKKIHLLSGERERLERKKQILETVMAYGGRGWDFVDNDNRPYDDISNLNDDSGESVRSFIVASTAAGDGGSTAVLPIRIRGGASSGASGSDADRFEDAVTFAEAYGARVINVSYSSHLISDSAVASAFWEQGLRDKQLHAVVQANKKEREQFERVADVMKAHPNLLFVLSAGDEGIGGSAPIGLLDADRTAEIRQGNPSIHAPNVIVVSAFDSAAGTLSPTAVYGAKSVQLAAPAGVGAGARSDYAAPYVAHAAAWLLSRNGSLTVEDVVALLRSSVIRVPSLKDKTVWGGYLNFESLREAYGARGRVRRRNASM